MLSLAGWLQAPIIQHYTGIRDIINILSIINIINIAEEQTYIARISTFFGAQYFWALFIVLCGVFFFCKKFLKLSNSWSLHSNSNLNLMPKKWAMDLMVSSNIWIFVFVCTSARNVWTNSFHCLMFWQQETVWESESVYEHVKQKKKTTW